MSRPTEVASPLLEALERLAPRDHLCLIYETQEEQFAAAIPFIKTGLERGERCIYIFDENDGAAICDAMRASGIDVDGALESGALTLATKRDAYLIDGYFDPDCMIGFLKEATGNAIGEGYSALRVTGEMTWQLGGDPGADRLLEYESKLNDFFAENRCLAICQYNRHRFSPELILGVIRTHPIVVCGGLLCQNYYYLPPEEFLKPNQAAREVERELRNIREREQVENLLRRQCAWPAGVAAESAAAAVPSGPASGCKSCLTQIELLEQLRLQSQRLEAMGRLAGGLADEFNSLLTVMMGYAEMLMEGLDPGDPYREFGREVLKAGHGAAALTNDLLAFARRQELRPSLVDLNVLVAEMEEALRRAAGEHSQLIHIMGPGLWPVKADRTLVGRVLLDLVRTLAGTLGPGGVITVQTSNAELKPGYVREHPELRTGRFVMLAISDNGSGLDLEEQARIFEPFFIPGKKGEGRRLGLSTAHGIVQQHGGMITVKSAPGAGTTFTVFLPPVEAGEAQVPEHPA